MDAYGLLCEEEELHSPEGRVPTHYGVPHNHVAPPRPTVTEESSSDFAEDTLDFMSAEEGAFLPDPCYWDGVQGGEVKDWMRTELVRWLTELCEAYSLSCLGLAVNILDRYLSVCPVSRSRLQCAAGAALLIASKLRDERPISGQTIWVAAGEAFSEEHLVHQEGLVLSCLKWRVLAVTADEFLERLLQHLGMEGSLRHAMVDHALFLLELSYADCAYVGCAPSLLCCSAISIAMELCGCPDQHHYSTALQARMNVYNDRLEVYVACRQRLLATFQNFVATSGAPLGIQTHQAFAKHPTMGMCTSPRESPTTVMDDSVFTFSPTFDSAAMEAEGGGQ